jgi:hypothetical protein
VKNCSAADPEGTTTAHKESSKGSAHEWAVFRACHFGGQALRPHEGARCTQGAPGRRRGQSWHRRPNVPANGVSQPKKGRPDDGVEPGHTSRPRDRSKCAHAVEFSKTVAPLRMGFPFQWGASAGTKSRFPRSGPMSIAPDRGRVEARFRRRHHQSTRSPARSQSASAAGRRSRSAPPAARSRARAARRRAESTPMGRSARLAGARGRSCRG